MTAKTYPLKDYMDLLQKHPFPELMSQETVEKMAPVRACYGEKQTDEVILEFRLDREEKTTDFSFEELLDGPAVHNRWYELDYESWEKAGVPPCICLDASGLGPGKDCAPFFESLPQYLGLEQAEKMQPHLQKAADALEGIGKNFYQLGMYIGRGVTDRVRLFASLNSMDDAVSFLKRMGWQGDYSALQEAVEPFLPWFHGGFILDLDLLGDGSVAEKLGVQNNVFTVDSRRLSPFLDFLQERGLCLPQKAKGVLRWQELPPQLKPLLFHVISHFKIVFQNGGIAGMKAYLKLSPSEAKPFRIYDAPALMNLELTNRCPLRCPQCYCDLAGGKDMPLETALYWIREAGKNHVQTLCLSGGETMLYPHLEELIREAVKWDILPQIAFSGWGLTKEKLQSFIDAGVDGIYISLNGSTEEINKLSRDGYHLAMQALSYLKELNFPRTQINWVMHSTNADDFENIVALAERMNVRGIDMIVFKPNAAHEMPTVPSDEQMRKVAKFIRSYKGPVKIDPEACFSQMRALVQKGFLMNTNVGINRGCGAGRDGVSVSLDGKLTPCRHLELEESFDSLQDYWQKSSVLAELRQVEDHKEGKCASCSLNKNCLPCNAVSYKMNGKFSMCGTGCPLENV